MSSKPDIELALLIDRLMRRIHTSLQSRASQFDTENVGPSGGMVLLTLYEMGRPEMSALTRRFARDKSQMTRMVRTLEKKGLITRETSSSDGRVSLLCLTPKGEQIVGELQVALAQAIDEILGAVSQSEKDAMKETMRRALS